MKNKIHWILVAWVVGITVLDLVTSAKKLPGGIKFYTVQLNSMAPVVPANSLIVARSYPNYFVNEIITFEFPGSGEIVTHRIVNLYEKDGQTYYITKGDSNEAVDRRLIPKDNVFGKTIAVIPSLGWLVRFVDTQLGLVLLIVIPAALVVRKEIIIISKEVSKT
jgi:signal peptidase I